VCRRILKTPADPRRALATTTLELIGVARASLRFPEDSAAGHPMRRELLVTRVEERVAQMAELQKALQRRRAARRAARKGNEDRARDAADRIDEEIELARQSQKPSLLAKARYVQLVLQRDAGPDDRVPKLRTIRGHLAAHRDKIADT
jgi:hypothetical protein